MRKYHPRGSRGKIFAPRAGYSPSVSMTQNIIELHTPRKSN